MHYAPPAAAALRAVSNSRIPHCESRRQPPQHGVPHRIGWPQNGSHRRRRKCHPHRRTAGLDDVNRDNGGIPLRQSFGLIFGLLVLLIFVETMTVFAVLASQRMTTEKALQQYTNELLKDVVDETRENAASYLRQAQDSVPLTAGVMEAGLCFGG